MKIKITYSTWSLNRVTGEKARMQSKVNEFPVALGPLGTAAPEKNFIVEEITDEAVKVRMGMPPRVLTLHKGEPRHYTPLSFGAGSEYEFELID